MNLLKVISAKNKTSDTTIKKPLAYPLSYKNVNPFFEL